MSQINGIGRATPQTIQQAAPQQGTALHGAQPSGAAIAGRVTLGIVTLGLSELIRAVVKKVAVAHTPPPPRVQTPATPAANPEDDLQNTALVNKIRWGESLPPACESALREGVDDLRAVFGDDIIPQGANLKTMPRHSDLKERLAQAVADADGQITPQRLRDMVKTLGAPLMAAQVLEKSVADMARILGYERSSGLLRQSVLENIPDLNDAVKAAGNRQAAEEVVTGFTSAIRERLLLEKEIADLQSRELNRVVTALAEGTGLSEETIRTRLDNDKLYDKLSYLGQDFLKGIKTAQGGERSNAFKAVTDAFVQNKLALWYSVDSLNLSPQEADDWKARVLTNRDLSKAPMLETFHRAGSQIDSAQLQKLLQMLQSSDFSLEHIAGYMEFLALRLEDSLQNCCGLEGWRELGSDGQSNAREFAARAMLDALPGLSKALQNKAAELQPLFTAHMNTATDALVAGATGAAEEDARTTCLAATGAMTLLLGDTVPAQEHNGQLARSLGQSTMSPPHLQAMEQTVVEARILFGKDCLPAGSPEQALGAINPLTSKPALETLEKAVRTSANPVSSTDMARLTAEAVRHAAVRGACVSLLRASAQAQGLELTDDSLRIVMDLLAQRHPSLWQNLGEAKDRTDLEAQLASLPELDALLRLEADIQTAWTTAMNTVYTRLSQATGLTEDEIRTRLDVRELENASLLFMRDALYERVSHPDIIPDAFPDTVSEPDDAPDTFPTSAYVQELFQSAANNFIAGKIGLYTSLDRMDISAGLKDRWKEQVLTNPSLKQGYFLELGLQSAERMGVRGLEMALDDEDLS